MNSWVGLVQPARALVATPEKAKYFENKGIMQGEHG
jgi:hypothetical protein